MINIICKEVINIKPSDFRLSKERSTQLEKDINEIITKNGQPPIYSPKDKKEKERIKRIEKENKNRETVSKKVEKKLSKNKITMWKMDSDLVQYIEIAAKQLKKVDPKNKYLKKYKDNKLYDCDMQEFIEEIREKCVFDQINNSRNKKKNKKHSKAKSNYFNDDIYSLRDRDITSISRANDKKKRIKKNQQIMLDKDIKIIQDNNLEDPNYRYKYSINMDDKAEEKYEKGKDISAYEVVYPFIGEVYSYEEYLELSLLVKNRYHIVRKKKDLTEDTKKEYTVKEEDVVYFKGKKKDLSLFQRSMLKLNPKKFKLLKNNKSEDKNRKRYLDEEYEYDYYHGYVIDKNCSSDYKYIIKMAVLQEKKPKKYKRLMKKIDAESRLFSREHISEIIHDKYYPKKLKKLLDNCADDYMELFPDNILMAKKYYMKEAKSISFIHFWAERMQLHQEGYIRSLWDFSDIDGCDYTEYQNGNVKEIKANKYWTYYDTNDHDINDLRFGDNGKIKIVSKGPNEDGMGYELTRVRESVADYFEDENGNGGLSYIGKWTDEEIEELSKKEIAEEKERLARQKQEDTIDKFINDPISLMDPDSENSRIREALNEEFSTTDKKKNKKNKKKSLSHMVGEYNDNVDKKKKKINHLIKSHEDLLKDKWNLDKKTIEKLGKDNLFNIYLANRDSYSKKQKRDADVAARIYAEEKLYKVELPESGNVTRMSDKQLTKLNTLTDMIPAIGNLQIE